MEPVQVGYPNAPRNDTHPRPPGLHFPRQPERLALFFKEMDVSVIPSKKLDDLVRGAIGEARKPTFCCTAGNVHAEPRTDRLAYRATCVPPLACSRERAPERPNHAA